MTSGSPSAHSPAESHPARGGIDLFADDGATRTGNALAGRDVARQRPVVRAIELALAAAWSRDEIRQTAERLEALDAATRAIAGVLSLERVLQSIVDRVRELIGAQYAALGIVDDFGVMERFVTSGISPEDRARIGPLPARPRPPRPDRPGEPVVPHCRHRGAIGTRSASRPITRR